MLTWWHALQIVFLAGLVALVIERVRAICFRGPVDVEPLVRAVKTLPKGEARELVASLDAYAAKMIAPCLEAEPGEVEVALEESLADARAAIRVRLQLIRVGATLSSFLGFVGAAIELGWVQYGDHGLLGLDPSRVAALGSGRAALSIALGVGGSSFALAAWMALRKYAAKLVHECERALDRLRGPGTGLGT